MELQVARAPQSLEEGEAVISHLPQPPTTAGAGTQRLLVPAYFTPSNNKWLNMAVAIENSLVPAIIVMNPEGGPKAGVKPEYVTAIDDCQARGQSVVGYVDTSYGQRSLEETKSDVDLYFDLYPKLRGIFFDQMSNHVEEKAYYRTLYQHVKSKTATARVIGNPGTPSNDGAWQITAPVADILIVFEGPYQQFQGWTPPSWVLSRPRELFAHLVYAASAQATVAAACQRSQQMKAGYVFVTPDVLPNPWDTPPSAMLLQSPTLLRRQVIGR